MTSPSAPDRWLVLEVRRPSDEEEAALLVDELVALSSQGVEEREDLFLVYLPAPLKGGRTSPDELAEEVAGALRSRLREAHGLEPPVTSRWQEHEDWAEIWRDGFTPRRITPRLIVSPSWEDPPLAPGEILLSLDPGMAFGTAEHPTTRGCLRMLDERVEPGDQIADVGAGSGILAIAATLLGAGRVVAIELDHWSCLAARENAEGNGVADRIEIREAAIGPEFLPAEPSFDGIVANIECAVLVPLLPGFAGGVREDGWLILSGILEHEVDAIVRYAAASELELERGELEEGWWTGGFRSAGGRPPP